MLAELGPNFLVLAVVIGVIGLIFGWILRIILTIAPFAYPNAKVRGMKGKLLSQAKLDDLMETSTLTELVGALEGTEYEEELMRASIGEKDIVVLEGILHNSLSNAYEKVVRMSPGRVREVLRARFKVLEVRDIKTILRALYAGVPVRSALEHITPTFESFYELRSVEEFVSKLEGTEYGVVLANAMTKYAETKSLQPLEVALDKYVYTDLWKSVETVSEPDERTLKMFFGTEIDVSNLKTLLRAKSERMPSEEIKPYLLPMGYAISDEMLGVLADADDVESIATALEGTKYGDILMNALPEYEADGSLMPLELALNSHVAEVGKKISISQHFGVGPMIGYLSSKDAEVRNLRAIGRGVEAKLPPEKIKNLLVM
ncbi:MAG: ATP synthase A1 subunit C [Methanocellales archaeon]|nr:ATP synthase A1 subunit C [Methanocellales archaeon]